MYDLPLDTLQHYLPERHEPDDFRAFWANTLAATREHPLDALMTDHDVDLPLVEVHDLSFAGFEGQRVRGWYLRPRRSDGALPCVVHFLGYGDGSGTPLEWLTWPAAGYAVIVMDTRGQGARARRAGATGDTAGSESPQV